MGTSVNTNAVVVYGTGARKRPAHRVANHRHHVLVRAHVPQTVAREHDVRVVRVQARPRHLRRRDHAVALDVRVPQRSEGRGCLPIGSERRGGVRGRVRRSRKASRAARRD
eukprot:31405-Pelagococcus_subviridis.AAC.2